MKYTLLLKERQMQQSRLEAEAAKEATIQNAEAAAQAKVIDSKAENERRKLLAAAEGDRIRVTAAADAERLSSEAAILKQNQLLINKIVAERLSDKLQIMMVPADGKFFFANVLRSKSVANQTSKAERVENNRDRFEPYHDGEIPNLATERGKVGAPEPHRPKLVSKPYRVEVLSHGRSGL